MKGIPIISICEKNPLLVAFCLQTVILLTIFQAFLLSEEAWVMVEAGDGIKNYFCYEQYLKQGDEVPLTRFNQMNYPYGTFVFYTDNTPLFSMALRWTSLYITDLRSSAFYLFHLFIIGGILLSTILTLRILSRFLKHPWLLILFSILLPWLCPQILRLPQGHLNLSLSCLILWVFYWLIQIYESRDHHWNVLLYRYLFLGLSLFLAAFIHLYYLPICLTLTMGFALCWTLRDWKKPHAWIQRLLPIGLTAFSAGLMAWLTIYGLDDYYNLRQSTGDGYNWTHWNFHLDGLFTSYPFNQIPFRLNGYHPDNAEGYGYLGSFALVGGLFLLIVGLIKPERKARFKKYLLGQKQTTLLWACFFGGLACLIISLGEYTRLFNHHLRFDNILHPFIYLSAFSEKITHFRVLARFNWVFFWVVHFWLLFLFNKWMAKGANWRIYILAAFSLLACVDAWNMMQQSTANRAHNPFVAGKAASHNPIYTQMDSLLQDLDPSQFQAILPLPFYHVGTETEGITIDPSPAWARQTFQLSQKTGLPLMSSMVPRTPPIFGEAIQTIISSGPLDPLLMEHLSAKPILVFYSESTQAWDEVPKSEQVLERFYASQKLPKMRNMKLLASFNEWKLYAYHWQP